MRVPVTSETAVPPVSGKKDDEAVSKACESSRPGTSSDDIPPQSRQREVPSSAPESSTSTSKRKDPDKSNGRNSSVPSSRPQSPRPEPSNEEAAGSAAPVSESSNASPSPVQQQAEEPPVEALSVERPAVGAPSVDASSAEEPPVEASPAQAGPFGAQPGQQQPFTRPPPGEVINSQRPQAPENEGSRWLGVPTFSWVQPTDNDRVFAEAPRFTTADTDESAPGSPTYENYQSLFGPRPEAAPGQAPPGHDDGGPPPDQEPPLGEPPSAPSLFGLGGSLPRGFPGQPATIDGHDGAQRDRSPTSQRSESHGDKHRSSSSKKGPRKTRGGRR